MAIPAQMILCHIVGEKRRLEKLTENKIPDGLQGIRCMVKNEEFNIDDLLEAIPHTGKWLRESKVLFQEYQSASNLKIKSKAHKEKLKSIKIEFSRRIKWAISDAGRLRTKKISSFIEHSEQQEKEIRDLWNDKQYWYLRYYLGPPLENRQIEKLEFELKKLELRKHWRLSESVKSKILKKPEAQERLIHILIQTGIIKFPANHQYTFSLAADEADEIGWKSRYKEDEFADDLFALLDCNFPQINDFDICLDRFDGTSSRIDTDGLLLPRKVIERHRDIFKDLNLYEIHDQESMQGGRPAKDDPPKMLYDMHLENDYSYLGESLSRACGLSEAEISTLVSKIAGLLHHDANLASPQLYNVPLIAAYLLEKHERRVYEIYRDQIEHDLGKLNSLLRSKSLREPSGNEMAIDRLANLMKLKLDGDVFYACTFFYMVVGGKRRLKRHHKPGRFADPICRHIIERVGDILIKRQEAKPFVSISFLLCECLGFDKKKYSANKVKSKYYDYKKSLR
jgi:hypothetical protein